jgi:hypothetical protein
MLATLKEDLLSEVKSSCDATQTNLATISNGLQNVVTTLNANSNQLTTLLAETLAKIGDSIEESKQARRDYKRVNSRITADGTYLQSAMDLLTRKVDSLNANTQESRSTPGTTSTFRPITMPPEWKERSHTMPMNIMDDGRSEPSPHNTLDRQPTTDLERLAAASMPTHCSKTAFSQMRQSAFCHHKPGDTTTRAACPRGPSASWLSHPSKISTTFYRCHAPPGQHQRPRRINWLLSRPNPDDSGRLCTHSALPNRPTRNKGWPH